MPGKMEMTNCPWYHEAGKYTGILPAVGWVIYECENQHFWQLPGLCPFCLRTMVFPQSHEDGRGKGYICRECKEPIEEYYRLHKAEQQQQGL